MTIKASPQEMQTVSAYIEAVSGIVLAPSKAYLVETRLGKLLKEHAFDGYDALIRAAKADHSGKLRGAIIDAISTQETSFFRDGKPFDFLAEQLIPDKLKNNHRMDIWCAAASTGQEIYSLAMIFKEVLGEQLGRYDVRILGTDISEAALVYCSQGRYSRLELSRGINAERLRRHFVKEEKVWKIADELRALATFKAFNLMQPLSSLGPFDLVMCRNVAIYFSPEDRKRLFERIADRLKPDGVLMIGATESLAGVTQKLKRNSGDNGSVYYTRA